MSFFKRIKDIASAGVNTLLDKAEDPIKMTEQYLRELEQNIAKVETLVAKQIATTKRFETDMRTAVAKANQRQQQAVEALQSGNEDLARRALADKKQLEMQASESREIFEVQSKQAEDLKKQLVEMKQIYQEKLAEKRSLEARHESAKAMKQINDSLNGFGENNLAKGFNRMEQKVNEAEALAEASKDLRQVQSLSLDDEFKSLETSSVDDDLEELKRQLNQ